MRSLYVLVLLSAHAWDTPIVVVPAVFKEWNGSPPWAKRLPEYASVFAYQRLDRRADRYSPNHGYEAGVHLQFIVEHYENLPPLTVFTQASPAEHNARFFDEFKCLDGSTTFTSLNSRFIERRGTSYWLKVHEHRLDAVVEQCWRDVLSAFNLSSLVPPKQEPIVSTYCCAQIAASAEAILRHPKAAYERAYAMLGGEAPCHRGPLDWDVLHASFTHQRDSSKFNRHTAGVWEHLNHVILGGRGLIDERRAGARHPASCGASRVPFPRAADSFPP